MQKLIGNVPSKDFRNQARAKTSVSWTATTTVDARDVIFARNDRKQGGKVCGARKKGVHKWGSSCKLVSMQVPL